MKNEFEYVKSKILEGDPWYTSDQFASHLYGDYRHNMMHRFEYARRTARDLRIVFKDKSVLDLGCGDGQWSRQIIFERPKHLIGVDYNPLRLTRYKKHISTSEQSVGSCLTIPIRNKSLDVVIFHQVLEHIRQPERALQEINRILKPDGWLIMSVPNEGVWFKQHVQYKWISPDVINHTDHVNFFTANSLRKLLDNNSFQVNRLDALGFYFPHNGISRRVIRHKWSFELGVFVAKIIPIFKDCLFAWCRPKP